MPATTNDTPVYDVTGNLIALESGELDELEVYELYQYLINTGMICGLQGSHQRNAQALIDAGHCHPPIYRS